MLPSEYYYMTGLPVKLNYDLGQIYQPRLFDFMEQDITIEEFAQPFCARVDVVDFGDSEKVNDILKNLKDFDLFFLDKGSMVDRLILSLSGDMNEQRLKNNCFSVLVIFFLSFFYCRFGVLRDKRSKQALFIVSK